MVFTAIQLIALKQEGANLLGKFGEHPQSSFTSLTEGAISIQDSFNHLAHFLDLVVSFK